MQSSLMKVITTVALLGASPLVLAGEHGDDRQPLRAVAEIHGCTDPNITGRAFLFEEPSDEGVKQVRVNIRVRGLPIGQHGVHIHEVGNCTPCGAAGGHFDPGPFGASSPDGNHPYHSGDLVNLEARGRDGRGQLNTVTSRVTLAPGPLSIFDTDGSAIIIHANPDTYCPDGAVAGCAGGARIACGIIELVNSPDD
ncbi:MAG: superoxide dismutase family protein [Gammaproteobacteria bacterium]